MERAARELKTALGDDTYGGEYFGVGRRVDERAFMSGYARYDRLTSNADVAAYLIWSAFPVRRSLDVGCATGFVVEALREVGVDAWGVDISGYAVSHAAAGARGRLRRADLRHRQPWADGYFDVVSALETIEHLWPTDVPRVIAELRRLCSGYVLATIPSFGPNEFGPGGWYQVKVRDDRVAYYESLGPGYEGPIPYGDLYRDVRGEPIEGHLTVASFSWWTDRFAEAGFCRCGELERRLHPDIARFGLTEYWNLYVFRVPSAPEPPADLRTPAERAEVAARLGLDRRDTAANAAGAAGSS